MLILTFASLNLATLSIGFAVQDPKEADESRISNVLEKDQGQVMFRMNDENEYGNMVDFGQHIRIKREVNNNNNRPLGQLREKRENKLKYYRAPMPQYRHPGSTKGGDLLGTTCFDKEMHEVICGNLAKKTVLELGLAWMFGRILTEGERGDVVSIILADGSTPEGKMKMKPAPGQSLILPYHYGNNVNIPLIDGYIEWFLTGTKDSMFQKYQVVKSYEVVKRRHYDCSLICDVSTLDEKLDRKVLVTEVLTRGATVVVVGGRGGNKCKMYCHDRQ